MIFKIVGALCVITGCGAVGFRIAAMYKYEEKCMRQLLDIVSYMEWELSYKMTPLPELCRQAVGQKNGAVCRYFLALAEEMDSQVSPNVALCCSVCLHKCKDIPVITRNVIDSMGQTLGKFDIEGQVSSLNATKAETKRQLELLCRNKDVRIRSYQTLGLCAGAALAILFI